MAELALVGRSIAVLVVPAFADRPCPPPEPEDTEPEDTELDRRRRPDVVRKSIVSAARTLFAEPGYGATSYRTIADAASTSESALLRHFGSKSALVQEAVFDPVVAAYSSCRERWTTVPASDEVTDAGEQSYLLVELYRFFRGQRTQLRLLMGVAHNDAHHTLNQRIREWLGDVRRDLAPDPVDVTDQARVGSMMAIALAAATLDDWFLPHDAVELPVRAIETALVKIASDIRDNST